MSRIRSLHPSLFTDERYMALSFPARELIKGIWCEADDQGVFEWKPLTLKARIMPADAIDMAALLDELIAGQFVIRFDLEGRSYGAVRNFRRFQRPKKPTATHLLPPEFRTYVGLSSETEEPHDIQPPPVPHQFPTSGGKPPQMEDGGGRMEDGKKSRKPERSESPTLPAKQRSFGESLLVRYALGPAPNQPLAEAPPTEQTFAWPKILSVEGEIVPSEVPDEWLGETYQSHPLVDGYAASESFAAYWTDGKGAGTTRTERGWHQCWRNWIAREKQGRSTAWIDRYGYRKHLHGTVAEPIGAPH